MTDNLITNTAHPPGKTCLAFSRDGSIAYTGGEDSLVRVWKLASDEEEPDAAVDAQEKITAIAADNNGWLSGSDDSHVRRYTKASTDLESLVTQAGGLPVRSIVVDPKGKKVAVTSDELIVKVIDLDDTTNIKILSGHTRGVRRATWNPSGTLLTTCGADGKIIVWNLSQEEPRIEKTIEGILPVIKDSTSDEYSHDCSAVWHNSGQYFIVGTNAHEIVTISRSTWSQSFKYDDDRCSGAVTSLALSVNGVYLASACTSGVYVWSTATRRVIVLLDAPSEATITQLAFSPRTNLLAWTDTDGVLTRWRDVIPASAPSPIKPPPGASAVSVPVRRQATPLFGEEIEGGDNNGGAVDIEAELDVDLAIGEDGEDVDNWLIDDIGGGLEDKPDHGKSGLREVVNITKAQPAFQPGATPFAHRRRYLAMNNIGVVEVVDQESHHIVNVEFNDQTTRRNYHFQDDDKYDLAAIGERGIAYASRTTAAHPARVTYKPYATWATQGEWTHTFPPSEHAVALAAGGPAPGPRRNLRARVDADVEGNGYVAVATNRNLVRFFSGGGVQRGPVWAVDGEIVAMVAGRDYVFVVHREGGTSIDGNQNLKYTLKTSDTFRVMHTGRLPIDKGETLKWVGITDEGAPVIYDSAERLMMLEHYRFTAQGSWALLLDTTSLARREGKDESYWPVGLTKSTFMCIILKGRDEYPGFPRPFVQDIDVQMPYLDMDEAETEKEERIARETILMDHARDALPDDELTTDEIARTELALDKELITLIQLACKADKLQRALDTVKLLHHTASFDMALRVAEFYKLAGLGEKITYLKNERLEDDRLKGDRDRRREWRSVAGPVPPAREVVENGGGRGQAYRPLQDTRPPPAIARARLTIATPSNEPSPFSRKPPPSAQQNGYLNGHSMEAPMTVEDDEVNSPVSDSKRKRDNCDDIEPEESISTAKRRQMDAGSSKSSQTVAKPNPFAKKSVAKEGGFSNNTLVSHKSLHNSDDFFNKVNAAEAEKEKPVKVKRSGTKAKAPALTKKQTTLFGLPAPVAPAKKDKSSKHATGSNSPIEVSKASTPTPGEQADATMDDADTETQESVLESQTETQVETQVETQEIPEDDAAVIDDDDDEPIEWPATPPPEEDV